MGILFYTNADAHNCRTHQQSLGGCAPKIFLLLQYLKLFLRNRDIYYRNKNRDFLVRERKNKYRRFFQASYLTEPLYPFQLTPR